MLLTILIVNFNSGNLLKRSINSIHSKKQYEILLIDNNSEDNSLKKISKTKNLKIIKNKINLGFSSAVNQGLKLAKGNYILLMNPDIILNKNTIDSLLNFIEKNNEVSVLGCTLLNPDKRIQPSCHAFPSYAHVFFESSQLNRLFPKNRFFISLFSPLANLSPKLLANYQIPKKPTEVDFVMGSLFLFKKSLIDEIGLFDEAFFLYHEEMELCYRAKKLNKKIFFIPEAKAIHYNKYSSSKYSMLEHENRVKGYLYFYKKHHPHKHEKVKKITTISMPISFLMSMSKLNFRDNLSYHKKLLKTVNSPKNLIKL